MFDFLKNLFSAPPFALYVADTYVQAVELKEENKIAVIKNFGHRQLAAGIVKNGEIINGKKLAQEIMALLNECKPAPIKLKKCCIALPESQIYEIIFHLPLQLKGNEFTVILEKLIAENIPISFHELRYDYHVSVHETNQVVFVAAIRQEILLQYLEVTKYFCQLNPIYFEPEILSLLRNIPHNFTSDEGIFLLNLWDDKMFWFLLWEGVFFDSDFVLMSELSLNEDILITDLQNILAIFREKTNRIVSAMVVSGESNHQAGSLRKKLESNFRIPVSMFDKYKVGEEKYKITCGLGLKFIGKECDVGVNINFIK